MRRRRRERLARGRAGEKRERERECLVCPLLPSFPSLLVFAVCAPRARCKCVGGLIFLSGLHLHAGTGHSLLSIHPSTLSPSPFQAALAAAAAAAFWTRLTWEYANTPARATAVPTMFCVPMGLRKKRTDATMTMTRFRQLPME